MSQTILAADPISPRHVFYHRERLRNRIFDCVLRALAERVRLGQATKATLAKRLSKDPAQISRWFNGPSNWTIDTISDLMLALEAELLLDQCLYEYLPEPNYRHYLADSSLDGSTSSSTDVVRSSGANIDGNTSSGSAALRAIITFSKR